MRLVHSLIDDAVDGILIHNIADAQGHKLLNKGHRLTTSDIEILRALGKTNVYVGILDAGDVTENEAAARITKTVLGENITATSIGTGRVNLFTKMRGILKVDTDALDKINALDGVTVATILTNSVVAEKKMVATVKTIGLAVAETILQEVERVAQTHANILTVHALPNARVAVILTGSADSRVRIEKTFTVPIHSRVQELGSDVVWNDYVEHDADAIADAIMRAKQQNVALIILAGETSIMDLSDVTPSGIVQAGGTIEAYGAPVEPGNLMLLAYENDLPILGAPGCVKSRDANVCDLILPRLLAGEHVRKRDIAELANGGLLI
jgi:molybdenum cofactor cytidylyltransferase